MGSWSHYQKNYLIVTYITWTNVDFLLEKFRGIYLSNFTGRAQVIILYNELKLNF